ncbi:MAG: hypothetical protein JWM68_3877, partial [Verrucomicrobiales bacterium]|nr:hypothetical protein [Verrucomicrobiales bacterium]
SMNAWMNGNTFGDPTGKTKSPTPEEDDSLTYTFFRRESQIAQPSRIWCLIDEDPSTINDSMFMVDMGPVNGIYDLPSNRHGNAYELTFADGHSETVKMLADPSDWSAFKPIPDPDWIKLKAVTTQPK